MSRERNPNGPINSDPNFLQFLIQALRQRSMSPQPPMPSEVNPALFAQPPQPQGQMQPAGGQVDPSVAAAVNALRNRQQTLQQQ